ncbi:MAG: hypothetical protein R3D60_12940 [Paracoccaceae bacterium]
MPHTTPPPRRVSPRRWAAATTAVLATAIAPISGPLMLTGAAFAQAESGEAGEAGMIPQDTTAGFLAELGLFEAAHRIVGALYARGDIDEARDQLAGSHHALYEDLADDLASRQAPGFAAETADFAQAVNTGASSEIVEARLQNLLAAVELARLATTDSAYERVMGLKLLLDVANADFSGGVDNGEILSDHEYRDAWGFVETVRAGAQAMTLAPDAAQAQAGRDILAQLERIAPLFPDLQATAAPGDPNLIAAAAGWVEIIALRLR